MFPTIKPTNHIVEREIGKADNRFMAKFQSCDMMLGGRRHPVEYEHRIQNDSDRLDPSKIYYVAGTSFGLGRYGDLEVQRYEMQFLTEEEVLLHFKAIAANKPPLSKVG